MPSGSVVIRAFDQAQVIFVRLLELVEDELRLGEVLRDHREAERRTLWIASQSYRNQGREYAAVLTHPAQLARPFARARGLVEDLAGLALRNIFGMVQ
jgi:hypothetical protein